MQVFGLLSKQMDFQAYTSTLAINNDLLIDFIDDFLHHQVRQPTVIVFDNATVYRSTAFEARTAFWQKQDLYIFFLPCYSPRVNLIEYLWRKMKYKWLRARYYLKSETLQAALEHILTYIGHEFNIAFQA